MKKFVVVIIIIACLFCMFNVAYAQEESWEPEQEVYTYEEILEEISGKLDVLEEIKEEISGKLDVLEEIEEEINILVGEEGILEEIKMKMDVLSEGIDFLSSVEDIEQIVEIKEWIKNINAMLFWIVVVVIPLIVFVILGWIILRSFF